MNKHVILRRNICSLLPCILVEPSCLRKTQNVPTSGQSVVYPEKTLVGSTPDCDPEEGLQWTSMSNRNVREVTGSSPWIWWNSVSSWKTCAYRAWGSLKSIQTLKPQKPALGWLGKSESEANQKFKNTDTEPCWHPGNAGIQVLHLGCNIPVTIPQRPWWPSPCRHILIWDPWVLLGVDWPPTKHLWQPRSRGSRMWTMEKSKRVSKIFLNKEWKYYVISPQPLLWPRQNEESNWLISSTLISLKFHVPLSVRAPLHTINKDKIRNSSQEIIIKKSQAHR